MGGGHVDWERELGEGLGSLVHRAKQQKGKLKGQPVCPSQAADLQTRPWP